MNLAAAVYLVLYDRMVKASSEDRWYRTIKPYDDERELAGQLGLREWEKGR